MVIVGEEVADAGVVDAASRAGQYHTQQSRRPVRNMTRRRLSAPAGSARLGGEFGEHVVEAGDHVVALAGRLAAQFLDWQ
jgi:hypothetical protein